MSFARFIYSRLLLLFCSSSFFVINARTCARHRITRARDTPLYGFFGGGRSGIYYTLDNKSAIYMYIYVCSIRGSEVYYNTRKNEKYL